MASSLFGKNNSYTIPFQGQTSGFNNPMQMMQQFAQFKQQMAGKDPKAMVDELVSSGKISQNQLNSLMQTAQSFMGFKGK